MHGWVRIPGAFSATEAAAMFGDVAPRCGGMLILSGSHRLVHRWFLDHPPRRDA